MLTNPYLRTKLKELTTFSKRLDFPKYSTPNAQTPTKVLLQARQDVVVRPVKVMVGLFYTGNRNKKNLLFHE
jgi:hypothetical protein